MIAFCIVGLIIIFIIARNENPENNSLKTTKNSEKTTNQSQEKTEKSTTKNKKISEKSQKYIETLQEKTKQKVLGILDDNEVQKTLERIEKSDEYYQKDGAIFLNREGKLPEKSDENYYAEWTVKTPGSADRGKRRIIAGKGGELWFTDDHYRNFTRIQ